MHVWVLTIHFLLPFRVFITLGESQLLVEETSFKIIKTPLVSISESCNFIHGVSVQPIHSLRLWIVPLNKRLFVCLYYEHISKILPRSTDNNGIHLRPLSADSCPSKGFLHVNM